MTDKGRSITMSIFEAESDALIKKHVILWYSHNSRDFITRTISWAIGRGYVVEIEGLKSERAENEN